MTIRVPMTVIYIYLALGAVLWLATEYFYWRSLPNDKKRFMPELIAGLRKRPWLAPLLVLGWPALGFMV